MTEVTKLVLVRHGQSDWNLQNKFTGWVDVGLSDKGHQEARFAGRLLADDGFKFNVAYTSYLKRAIKTLWHILEQTDQMWIPVIRDWRLNERHYGALQGLDKKQTVLKYGTDQVQQWRRGYAVRPPVLEENQEPHQDHRYQDIPIPKSESLADTLNRVIAWWHEQLEPKIAAQKSILIVAHGNSLRALVKHIDQLSENEVMALNIPTGIPLVYEFNTQAQPIKHAYLGDPTALDAALRAVVQQTDNRSG